MVAILIRCRVSLCIFTFALGCSWTASSPCSEPHLDANTFLRVDTYVEEQLEQASIPGAAVAIVQNGRIVHAKGYGVADPSGRSVTSQTPFVLGSVSKSITALAIMKLVEAKEISLDDPVQKFLPSFRSTDDAASQEITVRHLLSHTSGYSTFSGRTFFAASNASDDALQSGVQSLSNIALVTEPGAVFCYSNSNYLILGAIVESVSGQQFEDYVEKELFVPLGMENSFASMEVAREHGLAAGYRYWFGQPMAATDLPYNRTLLPAGYLISSAEDMGHYLISLLDAEREDIPRVLSAEGVRELFSPQFSNDHGGGYAMGWSLPTIHGAQAVAHSGSVESFHAFAAMFPSDNWGFVVLINAESYVSGPQTGSLVRGVVDLLFEKEPQPVQQSTLPLSLVLFILLFLLQLAAATRTFFLLRKWKKNPLAQPSSQWKRRGWHIAVPIVASVIIAVGLLIVLPRIFNMELAGFLLFVPDAGFLVIVSGFFAIIWGLVRTILVLRILEKHSYQCSKED